MRKSGVALLLLLACGVKWAEAATIEHIQMWSSKPASCSEAISNRPAPVTTFRPTDSEAYLWFVLRGGAAGDIVASEYYTPSGNYYEPASGPWPPNEAAGDYCFTDLPFAIAGAPPATMPGLWTVRVSVNGIAIAEVQFTITAGGGGNGPLPVISPGGVVNAADYTAAVAAGGMMSIFGSELAPDITLAKAVPLPLELSGVKVEVVDRGVTKWAALFFIAPGQINAQMPFGLESATVQVRVWRSGQASAAVPVAVAAYAPRLFTKNASGQGEAILLHSADWTVVNEGNPAAPGEYVILYLTGLGEVSPNAATGAPGGDNGANGAVNYCLGAMSVTMDGQNANVVFAGLAPGFVGLYQMNLQVPPGLQNGRHPVVVRSGAATSQANVHVYVGRSASAPEDVVKSALEAQVRGDIDGMFGYYALDMFPAENQRAGKDALKTIAAGAAFSAFQFTHLATAMGDRGTMAWVRAIVSYNIRTRDGDFAMKSGLLALTKKVDNQWKVIEIGADELLDTEIYLESAGKGTRFAKQGIQPLDLRALNRAVNEAMKKTTVNELKLGLSTANMAVGMMPGIGDIIANCYQVADTSVNVWEVVKELYNHGTGGILTLKLKQVGFGVLQILSEQAPGLDTLADLSAISLEQLVHNLERLRALGELRYMVMNQIFVDVNVNPRLYLWKVEDRWTKDLGINWRILQPNDTHTLGTPVGEITILHKRALDKRIPFQVLGEISTETGDPTAEVFKTLGAMENNGRLYLPVDLTHLIRNFEVRGPNILDEYEDNNDPGNKSSIITAKVTCRRGVQVLSVKLRSGEVSAPVTINPEFMNGVWSLDVDNLSGDPLELTAGQTAGNLLVIGKKDSGDGESNRVDLTNRRECLDMTIPDPNVATLTRGDTAAVTGVNPGQTAWNLRLAGDSTSATPDVVRSIPVNVKSQQPSQYDKFQYVSLTAEGEHIFRKTPGGETRYTRKQTLGSAFGIPISRVHKPLTWGGNSFSQSVTEAVDANMNVEYRVSGQLNGASKLQSITIYQRIEIKENTSMYGYPYKSTRVSQITATNLDRVGQTGLSFRFDGCNTGQHVAIADDLVSDFKYPGKEWQQETEKYERTNWCNPTQLQGFDPGVSVSFDENTWSITPPR